MRRLDEIITHYEGLGYEWDAQGWVFRPSRDGALAGIDAMPREAPALARADPVPD